MLYRIDRVAAYLKHAEAVGKSGVVVVGLAVSDWNDPAPPAWQTRSETELEQLMATTAGQLAAYVSPNLPFLGVFWVVGGWVTRVGKRGHP